MLNVLDNDFVQPGQHEITAITQPTQGGAAAIGNHGRTILYSPKPGFEGYEELTYTVDGNYSARVRIYVQSPVQDQNLNQLPIHEQEYLFPVSPQTVGFGRYNGPAIVTAVAIEGGSSNLGQADIGADGKSVRYRATSFEPVTIAYTIDGKHTARLRLSFARSPFLRSIDRVVDQNLETRIDVLELAPWEYFSGREWVSYTGDRLLTVASAKHGTVSIAADGKTLKYRPNIDYIGPDEITYLVDGHELSTASLHVIRRVRDDEFRVDPDSGPTELRVATNDQLGAGYAGLGLVTAAGAITGESVRGETAHGGHVTITADRRGVIYTPAIGFSGDDEFTYLIDGHLKAKVVIHVKSAAALAFPHFAGLEEFENWLIAGAISRHQDIFGKPVEPINFFYFDVEDRSSTALRLTPSDRYSQPTSHSETNVQVQGVDEADLAETDSGYLYSLSGGQLVISAANPGSELAVMSQTPIVGSPTGMYLDGDRLTIISGRHYSWLAPVALPIWYPRTWGEGETVVTILNIADRSHPRVVQTTSLDGHLNESRAIGDFVYLTLDAPSAPMLPGVLTVFDPMLPQVEVRGDGMREVNVDVTNHPNRYETKAEYVARIRATMGDILDHILPHFRSFGPDGQLVRSGLLIAPEEIGMPLIGGDPSTTPHSLVTAVSIDRRASEPGVTSTTGILFSSASHTYMTHDSLYLMRAGADADSSPTTQIVKFSLDEQTGRLTGAAAGVVPGSLRDQFSVDQSGDVLRIATTVLNFGGGNWSNVAENALWTLRQSGSLLQLAGGLQNLSPGESIRSVRFDGDRAVITTFPTANFGYDPVYVIGLDDVARPRLLGALTLPGFSQYMQFIDATHVLTVGMNAGFAQRRNQWNGSAPLQVTLFEVSDLAHPRLLDQITLEHYSTSLAQGDHHAFGWFAEHGLLALPIARTYPRRVDLNGDGYKESTVYEHDDEVRYFRIDVAAAPGQRAIKSAGVVRLGVAALRSAYIGDSLFAIGDGQIVATETAIPDHRIAEITWTTHASSVTTANVTHATDPLNDLLKQARDTIAHRFGVATGEPLLISIETPERLRREAGNGKASPNLSGIKLVFRVGDRQLVCEAHESGVALIDDRFTYIGRKSGEMQNKSLPGDVNGDGRITPLDALAIVDEINARGEHNVERPVLREIVAISRPDGHVDVNGDGRLSRLDAELAIDVINRLAGQKPDSKAAALTARVGDEALLAADDWLS